MSLFTMIALGLAAYCLVCYIVFWFYLMKGSSSGCGLDALTTFFWLLSPLLPPYMLVKPIVRGISNLRK